MADNDGNCSLVHLEGIRVGNLILLLWHAFSTVLLQLSAHTYERILQDYFFQSSSVLLSENLSSMSYLSYFQCNSRCFCWIKPSSEVNY